MRHQLALALLAGSIALLPPGLAAAQGRGHGGGTTHGPKSISPAATAVSHGPKATVTAGATASSHGPKTRTTPGATAPSHSPVARAGTGPTAMVERGPKTKASAAGATKTATARVTKSAPPSGATVSSARTTSSAALQDATTKAPKGGNSTAPPKTKSPKRGAATPNRVAATSPTLPRNAQLVARLRGMLPAGTDMNVASSGFRNQGQFVAAVRVSNNLGLPFDDLKTRMVDRNMSLGQAIHDLRPSANATSEAQRATRQAESDLGLPGAVRRDR